MLILRSVVMPFSVMPKEEHIYDGYVHVVRKDRSLKPMLYSVSHGWNSTEHQKPEDDKHCIPPEGMAEDYLGWIKDYQLATDDYYDILTEMQREIGQELPYAVGETKENLDNLYSVLETARDFAGGLR